MPITLNIWAQKIPSMTYLWEAESVYNQWIIFLNKRIDQCWSNLTFKRRVALAWSIITSVLPQVAPHVLSTSSQSERHTTGDWHISAQIQICGCSMSSRCEARTWGFATRSPGTHSPARRVRWFLFFMICLLSYCECSLTGSPKWNAFIILVNSCTCAFPECLCLYLCSDSWWWRPHSFHVAWPAF